MTPEQAIQILEQASAQAALNKQGHITCVQAIEVLKKALDPKLGENKPKLEQAK